MNKKPFIYVALVMFAAFFALMVILARGQEKPPAMPQDTGIKLRDAVLLQARLVIQLRNTIETYNQLQAALPVAAKKIDDLKAAALADAKLDPKAWDVDLDKFEFVPRAAPIPAEKKP